MCSLFRDMKLPVSTSLFFIKHKMTERFVFSIPEVDIRIHHHFLYHTHKNPNSLGVYPIGWSWTKYVTDPVVFNVFMSDKSVRALTEQELQTLLLEFGLDKSETISVRSVPDPRLLGLLMHQKV